jgi:ABC-type multidrug transport system ATPase subunit
VDEAEKICDRVAIMAEGKIQDIGTPSELKE